MAISGYTFLVAYLFRIGLLMTTAGHDTGSDILLVSRKTELRWIDLNDSESKDTWIPASGLVNVVALDYDTEDQFIYWSDVGRQTINRIRLDGSDQSIIHSENVRTVDGLTIDRMNRKLFWTDTENDAIATSTLDGHDYRVIVSEGLDEPRAIVIVERWSMIFWTDWGAMPMIERARTDGTGRMTLIKTNLKWPNGLVIDSNNMYWVDAGLDVIERADVDGSNRQRLFSGLGHPFGVSLYGDHLYWSDWENGAVETVNIRTFSGYRTVISYARQHVVIKAATLANGKDVILVPGRTEIRLLDLNKIRDLGGRIPLVDLENVIAVDYNPRDDHVYWSDASTQTISKAVLNGTGQKILVSNITGFDGVAVSPLTSTLFWTDAVNDSIRTCELDGTQQRILISTGLDQPRAIVLDDRSRMVYWTDWGQISKIERASYSGTNRSALVISQLRWPNALTLDITEDKLYWIDNYYRKMERSNLDGSGREELFLHNTYLEVSFGLAVLGDNVYWTDQNARVIRKVKKENWTDISIQMDGQSYFMGIKATSTALTRTPPSSLTSVQSSNTERNTVTMTLPPTSETTTTISATPAPTTTIVTPSPTTSPKTTTPTPQPSTTTSQPTTPTQQPSTTTPQPTTPTPQPTTPTPQPSTTTPQPTSPTPQPSTTTPQPTTPTPQPSTTTSQPTTPTQQPSTTNPQPTTPTQQPSTTTPQPTSPTPQPTTPTPQPTTPTTTTPTPQPTTPTTTTPTPTTTTATLEPTTPTSQPITATPTTTTPQPTTPTPTSTTTSQPTTPIPTTTTPTTTTTTPTTTTTTATPDPTTPTPKTVTPSPTRTTTNRTLATTTPTPKTTTSSPTTPTPQPTNPTPTTTPTQPVISLVNPLFGPEAGGTRITITGRSFTSPLAIRIGNLPLALEQSSETTIVAVTPKVDKAVAMGSLQLSITFDGYSALYGQRFRFNYQRNPTINSIWPLRTPSVGGTKCTVSGENLKSVAKPKMNTTVVTGDPKRENNVKLDTYITPCVVRSTTSMECITPNISLPQGTIYSSALCDDANHTRDCDVPKANKVTVFIGFLLDGVPDYKNLSSNEKLKDYAQLVLTKSPIFKQFTEFRYTGDYIKINGEHMATCCEPSEYKVYVGSHKCTDISVTDNTLTCLPPKHPPRKDGGDLLITVPYEIIVNVGVNVKVGVGSVLYKYSLPVMLTVTLVIILALLVIFSLVIVVKITKRRRKSQRKPKSDKVNLIERNTDSTVTMPPVPSDELDNDKPYHNDIRSRNVQSDIGYQNARSLEETAFTVTLPPITENSIDFDEPFDKDILTRNATEERKHLASSEFPNQQTDKKEWDNALQAVKNDEANGSGTTQGSEMSTDPARVESTVVDTTGHRVTESHGPGSDAIGHGAAGK